MIDEKKLFERCGQDEGLVKELLEDFVQRCAAQGNPLNDLSKPLDRRAHHLKGLAMNLALESLERTAREIERRSKENGGNAEDQALLEKELKSACDAARALLRRTSEGGGV